MPFYDDMGELMNIFQSIINDKTIHDDIIRYCHHIIELNLPYTIENGHHHIYEKKCSTLPYIIFIMNLFLSIQRHTIYHSVAANHSMIKTGM